MLEIIRIGIPDSSLLPAFFPIFCSIYIFAYHVLFRHWSPKLRPDASSCAISFAHGTPAAVLALCAILAQTDPGFASPNTPFQNLVLDFSTAYFLVDLLHYLVFLPGDYLFIAHHLATLFVFMTCRYVAHHGAVAILVLLVLAEVTSFCQNVWTLAGMQRAESSFAARIYSSLSPPFYCLYSIARGLAGPIFFYKMSKFYLTGKASDVISWWVSLSWIIVVGGAISVSILWVVNNWMVLYKETRKKILFGSEGKKKT